MNRAFTFSNPKLIERINRDFIPYSGNTAELQLDYGSEFGTAQWYTPMANKTSCHVQGKTTQGMYIAGADGTPYGWKNTPGISATARFLDEGLAKFKANPPKKVEIPPTLLIEPFSRAPKPATSVLEIFSRVRPVPEGADSRNYNVGRDYFWIYNDEVEEIAKRARETEGKFELPTYLVARLVRYGLVDVIRGEPDLWQRDEVERAVFTAERTALDEGAVAIRFSGDFRQAAGKNRGLEGTISGEFSIDTKTFKITRFRGYAKSEAWGASTWSNRGVPKGHFPLVFALIDVTDALSKDIPPGAVSRNQMYRHPDISAAALKH